MPHLHRYAQRYSHLKYVARLPALCKGEETWRTERVRRTALWIKTSLCLQQSGVSMTTSPKESAYSPPQSPTSSTSQWGKAFVKWAPAMSITSPGCSHPCKCVCGTENKRWWRSIQPSRQTRPRGPPGACSPPGLVSQNLSRYYRFCRS